MNDTAAEILFAKNGDLFLGKTDWENSNVVDSRRISDSGMFRDDLFMGEWFWTESEIYVSVLGRPHMISLDDGSIVLVPIPARRFIRGTSPNKKLSAFSLAPREFGVVEFASGDLKKFPTVGELKDLRWLSNDRVAVLGGYRRLSIYDHQLGKVAGDYELRSQITGIGSASPDGKWLIIGSAEGIQIFEVESGRFTPLKVPVSCVEWVSDSELLGSSSMTSSELRGLWRLGLNGDGEKLSGLPFDTAYTQVNPVVRIEDGALFVSGGNLWRYWTADKRLAQLTQVGGLAPIITPISK